MDETPPINPTYNQGFVTPNTLPHKAAPRRSGIIIISLLIVLASGLLLGFIANNKSTTSLVANPTSTTNNATTSAAINPGTLLTVRQVSEQVRPAVVQITSRQTQSNSLNDPFGQGASGSVQTGVGSGVIYDKTGLILTNFHVIDGADSLLVSLPDGRSFDGTVVGSDQQTDLAVIKIDSKGAELPIAPLGDSSQLYVGDGVVAIGNALALPGGPTVTSGVVSALNRSVTEPGTQSQTPFGAVSGSTSGPQLYGMIQTDAAINPGNSGGALVNMYGQVIGINTMVAGQAEPGLQAQGIGFAISINGARKIAEQLVTDGKVNHPFLGISYQPLTPAIAKQLGLTLTQGAVVIQVQAGSPAARAGLKTRDVISTIDGQKISDESTLGQIINTHQPGDKVKLEVTSPKSNGGNGQTRILEITLGQRANN
ncbi:MAG: trypsin-like peptidase domain-containing protein [Chloroflexi bacterium]|nr:trypsin-like peptidase domain-containing protein [Chloroflexota bacterium]